MKKKEDVSMLVQRFKSRVRVRKDPQLLARNANKFGIVDALSRLMVFLVCSMMIVGSGVAWMLDKPVSLLQVSIWIIASLVLRAALMSYVQHLKPQLADVLTALRWITFKQDLKVTGLWDAAVGATSSGDLNHRIEAYLAQLLRRMREAMDEDDVSLVVNLEHQYLCARSAAEALLGVSVPQLARFQVHLDSGLSSPVSPESLETH